MRVEAGAPGSFIDLNGLVFLRQGQFQKLVVFGIVQHVVFNTGRLDPAIPLFECHFALSFEPDPRTAFQHHHHLEIYVVIMHPAATFGAGLGGADDMGVDPAVGGVPDAEIAVFPVYPQTAADEWIVFGAMVMKRGLDFAAGHSVFPVGSGGDFDVHILTENFRAAMSDGVSKVLRRALIR